MPRYKTKADIAKVKSDEKKKVPYAKLSDKAVKVIFLDSTGATVSQSMRSYERRQQMYKISQKEHTIAEIRRKTIEMEQAYRKICESESKDLELITAGLARFKR